MNKFMELVDMQALIFVIIQMILVLYYLSIYLGIINSFP